MERNKNVVVNNGCYTREIGGLQGARIFHIPSRCSDLKKENALCYNNEEAGDPRQKPSGMTANFTTTHGFTLIELLVVVLIIGILAAVAVPQYQKAVMKSRFTQWVTYVDSVDKALDVWLLANGMPDHFVYFTGEEPEGALDVDLSCTKVEGNYCYTDLARFVAGCNSTGCWIDMGTTYDGYKGPFPSGSSIWTSKFLDGQFNGERVLTKVPTDPAFRKIVCEWGATHWGKNRMKEEVITSCAEVGI